MYSYLEVTGLYDPSKRFAFTNILDEDFVSHWDKVPIIVKAGETIEISNSTPIYGAGHAIAVKMTGEMVNKIMIEQITTREHEVKKDGKDPYYRDPKATSIGVPAARKPIEDRILRELAPDEESPNAQSERARLLRELTEGVTAQPATAPVHMADKSEFSEISRQNASIPTQRTPKPAKTKSVKI